MASITYKQVYSNDTVQIDYKAFSKAYAEGYADGYTEAEGEAEATEEAYAEAEVDYKALYLQEKEYTDSLSKLLKQSEDRHLSRNDDFASCGYITHDDLNLMFQNAKDRDATNEEWADAKHHLSYWDCNDCFTAMTEDLTHHFCLEYEE